MKAWQGAQGQPATGEVEAADWLGITGLAAPSSFDLCLQLTARFEGTGFTEAIGNFDGAFLTFGLIGFTLKHDLPALLFSIEAEIPDRVREAFGGDRWERLLEVAGSDLATREAFGDEISTGAKKANILKAWKDAFRRLGSLPQAQRLQIERARDKYWRKIALKNAKEFGASDLLDVALFYDTAVQNGGVNKKKRDLIHEKLAANPGVAGEARRLLWAAAIAEGSARRWHDDVLSRRGAIARGEGAVHGGTFRMACWGLTARQIDLAALQDDHVTAMPPDFVPDIA